MVEGLTIRGGAGPFEAAVIAVVLDRIVEEERGAGQASSLAGRGLSPWMLAVHDDDPEWPAGHDEPSRP